MYDRLNQREITNPHLISPPVLQYLQGKRPTLTEDHVQEIHDYFDRLRIVDKICENVFNHFKI